MEEMCFLIIYITTDVFGVILQYRKAKRKTTNNKTVSEKTFSYFIRHPSLIMAQQQDIQLVARFIQLFYPSLIRHSSVTQNRVFYWDTNNYTPNSKKYSIFVIYCDGWTFLKKVLKGSSNLQVINSLDYASVTDE